PVAEVPAPSTVDQVREPDVRIDEVSSIEELTAIDRARCHQLQSLGVRTVRDFLALSPGFAEQKLQSQGVTRELVRRWQAEAAFQCYGRLTDREARLLIGCGIADLNMLASLEVDAVLRRLESYLSSPELQQVYGASRSYTRARLSQWVETARQVIRS